jgi:hypothetical protein
MFPFGYRDMSSDRISASGSRAKTSGAMSLPCRERRLSFDLGV